MALSTPPRAGVNSNASPRAGLGPATGTPVGLAGYGVTAQNVKKKPGLNTLAQLLAKGTPGPLGSPPPPPDPKAVSKEAQSIRLARLLVRK